MPNWCMNNLTIFHDDPAKLQEFVDAYNSGETCQHYIPHPPEIMKSMEDPKNNDWYNWRCNNWGTKWDFGLEEYGEPAKVENNQVSISFDTAWSPPIEIYQKLYELGYTVHASYWEPGMAFCGWWTDGEDDHYGYESHDEIPVGLWDEFGMADFFEEFDETEADA